MGLVEWENLLIGAILLNIAKQKDPNLPYALIQIAPILGVVAHVIKEQPVIQPYQ